MMFHVTNNFLNVPNLWKIHTINNKFISWNTILRTIRSEHLQIKQFQSNETKMKITIGNI